MRPISINLASRPFYNVTLYRVAYGASLLLVAAMTALNLYWFVANQVATRQLAQARARLESEMMALEREEDALRRGVARLSLGQLERRATFAREAILQRSFSWTLLFNRLEEVLPPNVKLQAIRPSIEERGIVVRVVGVAKEPEAFAEFQDRLITSPTFRQVYPSSEVWNEEQRGLRFDLSFRYLPDGEAGEQEVGQPEADLAAASVGGAP